MADLHTTPPAAPRIADGAFVTLHYRLAALIDGEEREVVSTFDARPATLQIGSGQLAATLETRLVGLTEGDTRTFELAPDEAYGERRPELVQAFTRQVFDTNTDPDTEYLPGDVVEFSAPDGRRVTGVLKLRDEQRVVVDFNHPLAGLPLKFSVRVIGVL